MLHSVVSDLRLHWLPMYLLWAASIIGLRNTGIHVCIKETV